MTNGPLDDGWDRVASELRARKEAQRLAWGDLDDGTLGRYLAGEMSTEEQLSIEEALHRHPQLRELTSLVREVLDGAEPLVEPPPRILTLRQAPRRRFLSAVARRSSLAAACLLVIMGLAMPSPHAPWLAAPHPDAPPPAPAAQLAMDVAPMEAVEPRMKAKPDANPAATVVLGDPASARDPARMATFDTPVVLSSRQAVKLHREGVQHQKRGEFAQAERSLRHAHSYCHNQVGPSHPATRTAARHLAGVYRVALNTPLHSPMNVSRSAVPSAAMRTTGPMRMMSEPRPAGIQANPDARLLHQQLAAMPVSVLEKSVVPVLTEALKASTTTEERCELVRALGHLGPVARKALPVLTERLVGARDFGEAREVLLALEQMGEAARPAVPALDRYLRGQREAVMFLQMSPGSASGLATLTTRVIRRLNGQEGRVGIRDEAGCFTLQALLPSVRQLGQVARQTGIEVLVETTETLSPERSGKLNALGSRALWIAIESSSSTVEIKLSDRLRDEGIDFESVRSALETACRKQEYDRGLTEAVRGIQARVGMK